MRAAPSINTGNVGSINAFDGGAGISGTCASISLDNSGTFITNVQFNGFTGTSPGRVAHICWTNATPVPYIDFSAEL